MWNDVVHVSVIVKRHETNSFFIPSDWCVCL